MVFIISRILESAQRLNLPAELFYVMNAKIDQRLQKLMTADYVPDSIDASIHDVRRTSNEKISTRWIELQANDTRKVNIQHLKALDFENDTYVALPYLDSYIQAMGFRQDSDGILDFKPLTKLLKHETDELPRLPDSVNNAYAPSNLQ